MDNHDGPLRERTRQITVDEQERGGEGGGKEEEGRGKEEGEMGRVGEWELGERGGGEEEEERRRKK